MFAWTVIHADTGSQTLRKAYRATLVAVERYPIASAVDGVVVRYRAAEGTHVEQGEVIAELDATDAEHEVAISAAELELHAATLTQARREAAAIAILLEGESTTRRELERAEAEVAIAHARSSAARVKHEHAIWRRQAHAILAPAPGILVSRRKLLGQGVRAYETVCELIDPRALFAVIQVPTADLHEFELGSEVQFRATNGTAAVGTCHDISAEANPGSGAVQVRIMIDNTNSALRPGGRGEAIVGGD